MRCASLRSTVSLPLSGLPVWSVGNLYGPFPTTYTWGYYRTEVSCVFGKWLDGAFLSRLRKVTDAMTRANTCQLIHTYTDLTLDTAEKWLKLRTCYHTRYNDPQDAPGAPTPTVIAQDAGTGLRNVLLSDFVFLLFTQRTYSNRTATTIMMKLWTNLARYSDPNGLSKTALPHRDMGHGQVWEREFKGGREQLLIIRHAEETPHTAHELKPYTSMATFGACGVLSRGAEALHVQLNFTGVPPPRRRAAMSLMNWIMRGGGAANSSLGAGDDERGLVHAQRGSSLNWETYLDLQRSLPARAAEAAAASAGLAAGGARARGGSC